VIGRAYAAAGEAPPSDELQKRAEAGERKPGVVPPGGLLLTMGLDCQDDRVEWQLVAFGRDLRRWVVQYGVVPGSITDRETHAALDELVRGSWADFQGGRRPVDMLAIDGNAWTDEVYDWARRHPVARVIMVRGAQRDNDPPLAKVRRERGRDGKPKRYVGRFFNVGVSGLKLALYANLKKADPLARGHVDLPAGLDSAYFAGLTAERRVQVTRRDGFRVWRWVKSAGQPNEPLDTMLYAEAAALRLGWRTLSDSQWDRLEAEREAPVSAPQLDLEDPASSGPAAAVPLEAIDAELPDAEDDEAADDEPAEAGPDQAQIRVVLPEVKPHRPAAAVLRGVRRTGLVGRFRA
jgi:phage terminase large subunit GpA-like protein